MPYLYVYSPSDFVNKPASEMYEASGSGPHTLELKPGATPTLIEVTDDDAIFDEVDAQQVVTNDVDIDGNLVTAGTTIHTAYDLINSTSEHKVSSIHFGGDGKQGGAVHGIVSTVVLEPGVIYTFNVNRTSVNQDNPYSDYVACFTRGALIETSRGAVRIETLKAGDLIETRDHGFQPLRLLLRTKVGPQQLAANPNLCPIRISKGALGVNLPARDLLVSPQHRFLVISPIAERMFGAPEALVSAKKLAAVPGIFVDHDVQSVEYLHLVMDDHEIITANGTPTESFYAGPMALRALSDEARQEIQSLFPEMLSRGALPLKAREIPKGALQKHLIARHLRNDKPMLRRTAH